MPLSSVKLVPAGIYIQQPFVSVIKHDVSVPADIYPVAQLSDKIKSGYETAIYPVGHVVDGDAANAVVPTSKNIKLMIMVFMV